MSESELLARHRAVIPNWVGVYYDQPIEIVSGKGCRVTDAHGHGYLDFFAGILTNMLGYDVPEVRDAVERQIASGVVHTSTLYLIRGQVELAEKIAWLSGIENAKVFFTNSGTEANETALLAALTARGANQVLAMRGSYHGRSFGAVSVTGNAAWKPSGLSPFGTHYLHGADRQRPPQPRPPGPVRPRLHQGLRRGPAGAAARRHPSGRGRLPVGGAGAARGRVHHSAR